MTKAIKQPTDKDERKRKFYAALEPGLIPRYEWDTRSKADGRDVIRVATAADFWKEAKREIEPRLLATVYEFLFARSRGIKVHKAAPRRLGFVLTVELRPAVPVAQAARYRESFVIMLRSLTGGFPVALAFENAPPPTLIRPLNIAINQEPDLWALWEDAIPVPEPEGFLDY